MHTSAPATSAPLHRLLWATAQVVKAVGAGRSMGTALEAVPSALKPGTQALSFHVMRWLGSAQWARAQLAPKKPAPDIDALLTTALALLWPHSRPPYEAHTLVNEAVKAVQKAQPRASGFVNAVLRGFLRQPSGWTEGALADPRARWNHAPWWVQALQRDWPDHAEALLDAAQQHPPLTLRANAQQGDALHWLEALRGAGVKARPLALPAGALRGLGTPGWTPPAGPQGWPLPQALMLEEAVPVQRLPGFDTGRGSVQDAAAQVAAPLLLEGLPPRADGRPWRVLDACSAPGGKTAHLLELAPLDLWALDSDEQRLRRVGEGLARLGLGPANLKAVDARDTAAWWDGQPFDAVLLDAPCSGSGISRRHPDARWLRRAADIPALAQVQAGLLDALWTVLRPGGRLLYATCSLFKAEGQDQIDAFLQRQGLPAGVVDPRSPGHVLPLVDNQSQAQPACDGFFYALLHKP